MSENIVTVTATFGDTVNIAEGNFLFAASGTLMSSTLIAIVTPVINGSLDTTGSLWNGITVGSGVSLLASDNYGTGDLLWNCFLQIQGLNKIHVTDFPVNFANGATQNLETILAAAGWTPTSS